MIDYILYSKNIIVYLCIIFNYERTSFSKYCKEMTSIIFVDQYLLRTGLSEPMSFAIAGDNIFWTQRNSNLLYWTSYKNNGRYHHQVMLRKLFNVLALENMHLYIYRIINQQNK